MHGLRGRGPVSHQPTVASCASRGAPVNRPRSVSFWNMPLQQQQRVRAWFQLKRGGQAAVLSGLAHCLLRTPPHQLGFSGVQTSKLSCSTGGQGTDRPPPAHRGAAVCLHPLHHPLPLLGLVYRQQAAQLLLVCRKSEHDRERSGPNKHESGWCCRFAAGEQCRVANPVLGTAATGCSSQGRQVRQLQRKRDKPACSLHIRTQPAFAAQAIDRRPPSNEHNVGTVRT